MAIFWPKPWVNPFGKISIFRLFEVLFFYGLERRFCVVEYFKTHFPGLYCLKKRLEKWPFFDQNYGLTPLEKSQFFDFLNVLFSRLDRRFFVLEYCKTHFPGLYCLKKRHEKMAIFWPKLWVNPFGKILIFRLFESVIFIG